MAGRGELKFNIIENFGVLSTSKTGWNLELNLVQWGENKPKFDLRSWNGDHTKMGKGIGVTHDELKTLQMLIGNVLSDETAGTKSENTAFAPTEYDFDVVDNEDDFKPDVPKVGRLSD
ncbi:MAG: hypothetical protein LBT37_05235 [Lactobacillaceae bacterium]|nr:hypothetical protein [Lactobacillaceae bacterium]